MKHPPASSSLARWISRIAFLLSLVVIIARLTTPDVLRDPWDTTPGSDVVPAGPGPATGLVLDLLACLPAILVLIRRALDRNYRLARHWSHLLLFPLAMWAVLSTAWSADRFAAVVTAAHFFAASCLLWAMSQLVRSAGRFRIVSALAFGLLLVLVVQSAHYRFVDVPQNLEYWNQKKDQILKSHDWAPDSFAAKQFEHKLTSGELVGFFNSPNSFAAVGVLLFFACIGIGIQKMLDKEPQEWLILPILSVLSIIWILFNAKSKTSAVTPFVGVAVLIVLALFPEQVRRYRRSIFTAGVGLVAFAMFAIIGHGLYHHGLFPGHFSNSLDFRWKYWVASAPIFAAHPWIGVGWNNFGLHYLAHRLPEASEEIKDPHNFLVRFFVELGLIGGILCIGWLVRLAWELTTITGTIDDRSDDDNPRAVRDLAIALIAGMIVSVLANVDFNMSFVDELSFLMKPTLYLLALLMGTIGGAMLSPQDWTLDNRPASWIYYCTVTGLGLFLLHNLIDFSWFEAGAMFTFMALIGACEGMVSAKIQSPRRPGLAIGGAALALLAFGATAVLFVGPVLVAEQSAAAGNETIRTAPAERSPESAMHYAKAADDFAAAFALVPYNSDYLFREAKSAAGAGDFPRAEARLAEAKRINPLLIDSYLLDANLQLAGPHPDAAAVRADFQMIVKLNPNDVPLHLQYAQALDRFGLQHEAKMQYQAALNANAALPIGEPKRLTDEQVHEIKTMLDRR
jgi:O-antigen ligase